MSRSSPVPSVTAAMTSTLGSAQNIFKDSTLKNKMKDFLVANQESSCIFITMTRQTISHKSMDQPKPLLMPPPHRALPSMARMKSRQQ
jgi:hypothetical protein